MLLLAVENSDLLTFLFKESNLANWLILVVLLFLLWNKFMPGIFAARSRQIESSLANAAQDLKDGQAFLEDQRTRVAKAEQEANQMLDEARQVAEQMKVQIAEQTRKDADYLQKKLEQQIATQRDVAITELRSQAATGAVRLAEASLPGAITDSVKKGLQTQFLGQLDLIGGKQ